MPSSALAQLESLLSARKLDHTLASPLRYLGEDGAGSPRLLPRPDKHEYPAGGMAMLGTLGELPRGQISEIAGPRSSGRQAILVSWLAAATARGELTALVDALDMFDPPSAAAAGVDLSRVLWVRGRALGPDRVSLPREAGELRVLVEQAVKALNLILQAGGFGLVALDLGEMPMPVLGRLPFTTWRRLHRVIAGGDTVCVVVAGEPVARSVGGVTLVLEAKKVLEAKPSSRAVVKSLARHVRVFPHHQIEGRLVHARSMRTERVQWPAHGGGAPCAITQASSAD